MVDRYGNPTYMGDMSVEISAFSQVGHQDIAPFADGINEHILAVRTKRYNIGPPAAGNDIIIMVIILVSGQASVGFFGELGKDIYYGLREQLLLLYHRARQKLYPGPTIPMTIVIGKIRFNFEGELSREELLERVNSAHEYMQEMSSSYLDGDFEKIEVNLSWHEEARSWKESTRKGLGSGDVEL